MPLENYRDNPSAEIGVYARLIVWADAERKHGTRTELPHAYLCTSFNGEAMGSATALCTHIVLGDIRVWKRGTGHCKACLRVIRDTMVGIPFGEIVDA